MNHHLQETDKLDKVRQKANIQTLDLPRPNLGSNPLQSWHLWIRMLYSSLVDADFLDTERFMDKQRHNCRGSYATFPELKQKLDVFLKRFEHSEATSVNVARSQIQNCCRTHGKDGKGIYSLTVPTGGGKTISSLVWAMEHAIAHNCSRIIFAIPYTTIVAQTADTLKQIFGELNIVEHHSNVDFDSGDERVREKSKLATENWDAPIIVTTNVQLFESLYANKSSRCRKLHNIANSVIVLDEVQTLPPENLRPIVDILATLNDIFGVSILFTTATKPALTGMIGTGEARFEGLQVKEIIPDIPRLFQAMKRVSITFLPSPLSIEDLADRLKGYSQALCVMNRRQDAKDVYEALKGRHEYVIHLSRWMCQQHIVDQLQKVKIRLSNEQPVIVVSTQLIEAGVDIDFPVVYRAMAGLDSIAQSAGRCNREGRLSHGSVFVFDLQGTRRFGLQSKAASASEDMLALGKDDFLDPDTTESYFKDYYGKLNQTDKACIVPYLYSMQPQFATAAGNFHLIPDDTVTVFVPYEHGADLIAELRQGNIYPWLFRKLQRYSVALPLYQRESLAAMGAIQLGENLYYLPDSINYDDITGLVLENNYLNKELII